jgi:hypothetical protein
MNSYQLSFWWTPPLRPAIVMLAWDFPDVVLRPLK